jgi:hypothetical protein
MLRNAVSAYGARLSVGAAAVAAPAVASCAKDEKKTVTSSFDPEALERGAKALREINNSTHAKRVRRVESSQRACASISTARVTRSTRTTFNARSPDRDRSADVALVCLSPAPTRRLLDFRD